MIVANKVTFAMKRLATGTGEGTIVLMTLICSTGHLATLDHIRLHFIDEKSIAFLNHVVYMYIQLFNFDQLYI